MSAVIEMDRFTAQIVSSLDVARDAVHALAEHGCNVCGVNIGNGLPRIVIERPPIVLRLTGFLSAAQPRTEHAADGSRRHLFVTRAYGCRVEWVGASETDGR